MEEVKGPIEKVLLECELVGETKRFRKYRLPEWLIQMEQNERDILFSSDHVYVYKDEDHVGVKQIVIMLKEVI